VENLQ